MFSLSRRLFSDRALSKEADGFVADPDLTFDVFIENEAGSTVKNSFDETTLAHLRARPVQAPYPFAYGFVRHTKSGDGDALDCFVITSAPLKSGEQVACRAVHLLEQVEDGATDNKVLAVPVGETARVDAARVDDIRKFIMTVFSDIPGKSMELGELRDAAEARRAIAAARTAT